MRPREAFDVENHEEEEDNRRATTTTTTKKAIKLTTIDGGCSTTPTTPADAIAATRVPATPSTSARLIGALLTRWNAVINNNNNNSFARTTPETTTKRGQNAIVRIIDGESVLVNTTRGEGNQGGRFAHQPALKQDSLGATRSKPYRECSRPNPRVKGSGCFLRDKDRELPQKRVFPIDRWN